MGVGGDRQQSHEAQAASDKCLQNGLETRVAHARKHDSQCENAETFRFNIEHNALLVKTVGAFELSVPAGAGVAMQQTPDQSFQIHPSNNQKNYHHQNVMPAHLSKFSRLLHVALFQLIFDG